MKLDRTDLEGLLPHRPPMLILQEVSALEPGVSGAGSVWVGADDPWLEGHFPGNPILPGVMIVEALAQLSAAIYITAKSEEGEGTMYLLGIDGMRFRRPVVPGDRLDLYADALGVRHGIWRYQCRAEVGGVKVADGILMAVVKG